MRNHRRDERGAALVEASLVMGVLTLLTFAIIDIGLYFSAYNSLGTAARDGARHISVQATEQTSDYEAIQVMKRSLVGLHQGGVDSVVVYRATGYDDPLPTGCAAGSQLGSCTYYSAVDLERPEAEIVAMTASGWLPADRKVSRHGGTDLVGVAVTSRIDTPMGILGNTTRTVTRTVVLKLESEEI